MTAAWLYCFGIFVFRLKKKKKTTQNPTPTLDPNDPFNDDERERQEVEALAKKFENKYVSILSPLLMAVNKY